MPHQRLVLVLINAAVLSVDTNIVVTYTIRKGEQDQGSPMGKSALQGKRRRRKPFDSLEQEVGLNLARTEDELMQEFAKLFGEHGLSPSQYNVLRILRGLGGGGTPCPGIA